mmetsp:Transcript_24083/g.95605  ORF Transcript_24083/g.95605 Transcript_24083/m.95605 type:complete len:324 (-) Transcript_24083:41-1012(-)
MNDDEELGQSYLYGDDDDDDGDGREEEEEPTAPREVVVVAQTTSSSSSAKKTKGSKKRKAADDASAAAPPSLTAAGPKKKTKKQRTLSAVERTAPASWPRERWVEWLVETRAEASAVASRLEIAAPAGLAHFVAAPPTTRAAGLAVLVVCASAARCAAVAKTVPRSAAKKKKTCASSSGPAVAKLFGKHLDLDAQVALLRRPPRDVPRVAVGTAVRLEAIARALDSAWPVGTSSELLVVVDAEPDSKNYTPFTLADARHALAKLVAALLEQRTFAVRFACATAPSPRRTSGQRASGHGGTAATTATEPTSSKAVKGTKIKFED